uniref:Basic secretory protease (Fragments) n=1 Tax=Boswellia serrata TaxID=613112 RepID=BSP_BOSSE|nr:RecName: Full=Basic secretory protease; AltName: Full=Boswellia basic secretory protease; Short=BBSP [Boswellia serrata]
YSLQNDPEITLIDSTIEWDEGYDVTARFLDYLNSLDAGFVAELENKTVEQLWSEYKASYGPNGQ